MSDLKFDKNDLDMILEGLNALKYESCKEAVADPYFEGVTGVAADIHGLMFMYKQREERYIELYMEVNPNQKDFFHCPKCKRILNVYADRKLKDEDEKSLSWRDLSKREEIFYCKDCGWNGEEAPFEEVKVGENQTE